MPSKILQGLPGTCGVLWIRTCGVLHLASPALPEVGPRMVRGLALAVEGRRVRAEALQVEPGGHRAGEGGPPKRLVARIGGFGRDQR